MIQSYDDFCRELLAAGFSCAGKDETFSLIGNNWNEEGSLRWHTGDPEADPWEWRIRVLDERDDIAYAKVFNKKAGFITRAWYPYFLAARRGGISFAQAYMDGTVTHNAKRIYEAISAYGSLPTEEIKRVANFSREDKSKFDSALNELQMRLFVTIQGQQLKFTSAGESYGMPSTVFCTTEHFWGEEVFAQAAGLSESDAVETIAQQIMRLNPAAQEKKVLKFIKG